MRLWTDVGIELPYGASGEVRLTCPRCSPSRRKSYVRCLAVNVDKGTWRCWHCAWAGGLYGHSQAPAMPPLSRPPAQPDERKRATLRRVWGEAGPITIGDPVHTYLHQRGIPLPLADRPTVLRYHPHLIYRHEDGQRTYHPAMVARVDNPSGCAVTLHRTYLTSDGRKAAVDTVKKLMSPAIAGATRGGAIRLYQAGDTLAIAEGIETALAVHLATGLPVWSTICAGGMERLVVPAEVQLVVICADHDTAGLNAARALARRLLVEQRRVKILTPDTPGADWADLQEVGHG
jgi:putative DNA primase/helicase